MVILHRGKIEEYFRQNRERPAWSFAMIIMDYKIKLDPILFREAYVEIYRNRGMSWHETLVLFRREDTDVTVGDDVSTIVLERIAKNEKEQDRWVVLSILEAGMYQVKKEIPTVRSTWTVTGNARKYQSYLLPVVAPFVTASHAVKFNALIHPETAGRRSWWMQIYLSLGATCKHGCGKSGTMCEPKGVLDRTA